MDNKNKNAMPPEDFAPLYKIAAVMLAAGALMLCLSLARLEYPLLKFGVMGLGITLITMGVAFIFIINSAKKFTKQKRNYFLYDRKTRKEIDVGALTFADIRAKVQKYMSLFRRGKKLYVGDLFNNDINIPSAIRTLFCYELLYEISESSADTQKARTFLSFGNECAGIFYSHLAAAGELQLAEKLRSYFNAHSNGEDSAEKLHKFLDTNKKYLESAIVRYTKDHIDEF